VVADCHGLPTVTLMPSVDSANVQPTATGFVLPLPMVEGGQVALTAILASSGSSSTSTTSSSSSPPMPSSTASIGAIVSARRAALKTRFAAYANASIAAARRSTGGTDTGTGSSTGSSNSQPRNETVAGLVTAISWNVIYTPYEGIFTPVFRGRCM
jgi:hypothetical protein